jgi:hypothetical protein
MKLAFTPTFMQGAAQPYPPINISGHAFYDAAYYCSHTAVLRLNEGETSKSRSVMPNPAYQGTNAQKEIMRTKKASIASEKLYVVVQRDTGLIRRYANRRMSVCGLQQKRSRPAVLSSIFTLLNWLRISSFRLLIHHLSLCIVLFAYFPVCRYTRYDVFPFRIPAVLSNYRYHCRAWSTN